MLGWTWSRFCAPLRGGAVLVSVATLFRLLRYDLRTC
jgi:hypothetical protein